MDRKVLILNKVWTAIHIATLADAILNVVQDRREWSAEGQNRYASTGRQLRNLYLGRLE